MNRLLGPLRWITSFALLNPFAILIHRRAETHERRLQQQVLMGTVSFSLSESCMISTSQLSSSNFFDGLVVRTTPSGTDFRKDAKSVTEYPTDLTIEVAFLFRRCSDRALETPEVAEGILEGFRYQPEWKRGLEVRSVSEFSYRVIKPVAYQGQGSRKPESVVWRVYITVKDARVPLTDDLVLSVFSALHKNL